MIKEPAEYVAAKVAHKTGHEAHNIFIGAAAALIEGKWLLAVGIALVVVGILAAQVLIEGEG